MDFFIVSCNLESSLWIPCSSAGWEGQKALIQISKCPRKFVWKQQSSCWQRWFTKAAGLSSPGPSREAAGLELLHRAAQAALPHPSTDDPGACRASFILNALKVATLLLSVLHYFLRTLVYTQCCGTILIQWWCAFFKGITFGTLSGSWITFITTRGA